MKHPSILFAFLALATGIVAGGFVGVRAVNGEILGGPLAHLGEKQLEGILPALADTDAGVSVVFGRDSATTIASMLHRGPCLVCGRPLSFWTVPVFRRPLQVVAFPAFRGTTGFEIVCGADSFSSAVAAAKPGFRFNVADDSPGAETLSSQIDDSGFVGTIEAHCLFAFGKVRAAERFLSSAVAATEPVLAPDVRKHGVPSESFTSEINEPFRASHLRFSVTRVIEWPHELYLAA